MPVNVTQPNSRSARRGCTFPNRLPYSLYFSVLPLVVDNAPQPLDADAEILLHHAEALVNLLAVQLPYHFRNVILIEGISLHRFETPIEERPL